MYPKYCIVKKINKLQKKELAFFFFRFRKLNQILYQIRDMRKLYLTELEIFIKELLEVEKRFHCIYIFNCF